VGCARLCLAASKIVWHHILRWHPVVLRWLAMENLSGFNFFYNFYLLLPAISTLRQLFDRILLIWRHSGDYFCWSAYRPLKPFPKSRVKGSLPGICLHWGPFVFGSRIHFVAMSRLVCLYPAYAEYSHYRSRHRKRGINCKESSKERESRAVARKPRDAARVTRVIFVDICKSLVCTLQASQHFDFYFNPRVFHTHPYFTWNFGTIPLNQIDASLPSGYE